MALDTALGWSPRQLLPQYDVTAPRNAAEAIEQGERIAAQERQRIGMGAPWPVENVSALVYSQWVRTIAADLPRQRNRTGRSPSFNSAGGSRESPAQSVGAPILVDDEYAPALFDRRVAVTKRETSDELTEKPANAFAAALLMPGLGVEESLAGLNKGWPSRGTRVVFAVATGEAARAEVRSTPGSQGVTWQDVATVARKFGAPYSAMVVRLIALGTFLVPIIKLKFVTSDRVLGWVPRPHATLRARVAIQCAGSV
jgi:hypothetical protein